VADILFSNSKVSSPKFTTAFLSDKKLFTALYDLLIQSDYKRAAKSKLSSHCRVR
jgi:hypothetical protein